MENDKNKDVEKENEKNQDASVSEKNEQSSNTDVSEDKKAESKKEQKIENQPDNKKDKATKKEGKLKLPIIIVSAIVIIIIALTILYFLVFAPKTLDLSKYLSIEYTGYDGYATATVEIDTKALKKDIDSDIAKKFAKKAELEIEDNEDLKNGDELKIKVKIKNSWLEDNKLKLKDSTVKIKVEGIEKAKEIDLSDYIDVEYEGYNKHATATVKFNKDLKDEFEDSSIYNSFISNATLEVKDNENLANEQEIEISVEIPSSWLNENGIALKSDTIKVQVSDLKDATEIDVFKDINVEITGMSPDLKVTISTKSDDEFIKTVRYSASKTSGISNGEKITITASSWDKKMAESKGYVLKKETMEYTVDGQAAYIFSTSEIKDDVKTSFKNTFIEKATSKATEAYDYWGSSVKKHIRNDTDYKYTDLDEGNETDAINQDLSIGNIEVASMYLLTKKEDKISSF